MYIRTSDGFAHGSLQYTLGDAALCIRHGLTNGELCTFTSKKGGSTTAVYVPNAARGTNPVNLLVWIHGDLVCGGEGKNAVSYLVSKTFPLAQQLADSKRPFVLVTPTMNWNWKNNKRAHSLGSPKGMNEFLEEVRSWLTTAGWSSAPSFGRLILAGHSRAYVVLNGLAAAVNDIEWSRGALATLTDVWLLDTTYGRMNKKAHCTKWITWAKTKSGVNLRILYRRDTGTAAVAGCIHDEAKIAGLQNVVVQGISSHCSLPREHMPDLLAARGKHLQAPRQGP
jgi:hypothetical protein